MPGGSCHLLIGASLLTPISKWLGAPRHTPPPTLHGSLPWPAGKEEERQEGELGVGRVVS